MSFPDLSQLLVLFERIKSIPGASTILAGSGIFVALLLVSHYRLSRKQKYICNLANVGSQVGESIPHYDIIIVGGGTSGCVLASRLSEDPRIRVLLLEAGQSGAALSFSRTPALFGKLFPTKHVLPLRTEPQASAKGRTHFWPRAKMLGGCSSINAQMAQYGAPEDFDQWATFIGDDSWSWKNFKQYITKFERYIPHPEYPLVDASVRGSKGPVRIGYFNTVTKTSKAFVDACVNVGIPFTPDFNGPNGTLGVSRAMTYIDHNKQRVSSESAYLTDDVVSRKNLTVAINAQVTRILFEKQNGETHAIGVEFANSSAGPRYRALASREVIISAGAVQSPQLLMLSGVGPASHLQKHSIPVVHDLPGIGNHLVDHPVVDLYFKDKHDSSLKYFQSVTPSDVFKTVSAVVQYSVGKGGPLATNFGESAAFIRSDDPVLFPKSEYPETLPDSTSGAGGPDLELFTTPLAYKEHGAIGFDVHTYALHVYLLRPSSTGSIQLRSSSPWDLPIINPNYLKEPADAQKLLRGVRLLLKIAQTSPLSPYLDHTFTRPDLDHKTHLKSDEELLEMIRDRVETIYHPTSTCRMAPADKDGVVDAQLRVYGIHNLRVCDASIFPWIVSGHTAGACLAIAEKLAAELKSSWVKR